MRTGVRALPHRDQHGSVPLAGKIEERAEPMGGYEILYMHYNDVWTDRLKCNDKRLKIHMMGPEDKVVIRSSCDSLKSPDSIGTWLKHSENESRPQIQHIASPGGHPAPGWGSLLRCWGGLVTWWGNGQQGPRGAPGRHYGGNARKPQP